MIEDRHVHYHIRPHEDGVLLLFVLQFHYDCEILVVDKVGIHVICADFTIGPNIAADDQVITNEIYHDVIGMLHRDGIC